MECSVWYQAAKDPGKVERSSQEMQLGGGDVTKINVERPDSKIKVMCEIGKQFCGEEEALLASGVLGAHY